MNKFSKALSNELVKISKRKILIVFTSILVGVMILSSAGIWLLDKAFVSEDYYIDYGEYSIDDDIAYYEENARGYKEDLDKLINNFSGTEDVVSLCKLVDRYSWTKAEIARLKLCKEVGFNLRTRIGNYNYKNELIQSFYRLVANVEITKTAKEYKISFVTEDYVDYIVIDGKRYLTNDTEAPKLVSVDSYVTDEGYYFDSDEEIDVKWYNYYLDIISDEKLSEYEAEIAEITRIVKESDFNAYVDREKEELKLDIAAYKEMNDGCDYSNIIAQCEMELEILEYRQKSGLTGEYESHDSAIESISNIFKYRKSIEQGIDYVSYSQSLLLPSQLDSYKQALATLEYKLNSGYFTINEDGTQNGILDSQMFASILYSIATVIVLALMIFLAGSMVSNEMSSGAVKGLLVSPVKRKTIFAAKSTTLALIFVLEGLIVAFLTVLLTGIFNGFGSFMPYIYVKGDAAHSIPFAVIVLCDVFIHMLPTLFYGMFALMLSSLFKNSAGAIIIPFAVFYLSSSITTILSLTGNAWWTKYIPMYAIDCIQNDALNLPSLASMLSIDIGSLTSSPLSEFNMTFGVIYIFVLIATMWFTARDAFCRKDIK